ncbi:hypothetical protein HanIR_Chr15g0774161 [Helianthus annuus]|nr:hypothetical protein HanIR_Chr15g0774161 [Helianthus annuus]
MLQQQIMFKQLEELQRKQKLKELNQQSLVHNKQALGAHYAPLINGTPVRDASQMFMFGNTNLAHGYQSGFPYSQAQNELLHSTSLASQLFNGHSVSRSCMSDQINVSYQDRNMIQPALSQTKNDQQEQDVVNPSQELNSLDPMERKFLYDTNDDNLGSFGNMFEDIDKEHAFPSLQNGSWSALMQSAVEETSSTDTGVQEERSGLSFQNPELSNDNQTSGLMDSGKNLTPWQNNSFQTGPSLKASSAQVQRFSPLQSRQGSCGHSSVPQYFGLMLGPPTQRIETASEALKESAASGSQSIKNLSHPLQDAYPLYGNSSSLQMKLASKSQYGRVWPVTGTSSLAINQDLLVPQSKKRKFSTYELLPWHKEATKGSSRLLDMSTAEVEWAQAAKRVPEMLKEDAEALGYSTRMVPSKKRVILSTQLMQVLFRPAPAAIPSDDAPKCYNTLTYFAARLALGDACSLSNRFYTLSGNASISKGSFDQNLSKIVEDFMKRANELENDILRFENGGSVLQIRMASQDLERFLLINRFAKFHSRAQMVPAESASSGGASTAPKLYPQRYVIASPMPTTVPQGYNCLSL